MHTTKSLTTRDTSGREQMKFRSEPAVALNAADGSSNRDSDTINRSIAAVST